jgi:hypothetical protein
MPLTPSPSQVPALHSVPLPYLRQPPLPSQVPSNPQVEGVLAEQTEGPLGWAPDGTKAQSPRELRRLHALQVSPQAEVQQMPSTQNPVWHSRSQLQDSALPLDLLGVSDVQVLGGRTASEVPEASRALASALPPPSTPTLMYVPVLQAAMLRTVPRTRTIPRALPNAQNHVN